MTTIIGVEYEDRSEIMADSRVTDDNGKVFSHPSMTKINERGAFIIAGAGEILPCDVIQHIWTPPKVLATDKKDLYHFMVVKVIPSMRQCLKENGYNFDEPGDNRFFFLVAVCGELFELDDQLGISKSDFNIYGIGSGSSYAIGALMAGASMEWAMEIASKATAFTAEPFNKITQYK